MPTLPFSASFTDPRVSVSVNDARVSVSLTGGERYYVSLSEAEGDELASTVSPLAILWNDASEILWNDASEVLWNA